MAGQVTATEGAAGAQLFVINLCASTSPMALTHPSTPELKKHTFFVTRQREDGRERFRLHMGYFTSQQEAEALLASVRDIYPAAWAGPAPSSPSAPRRMRPETVAAAVIAPPAPVVVPVAAPVSPPVVTRPVVVATPAAPAAPMARKSPDAPVLDAMSNVRNVLAQLSDTTPRGMQELSLQAAAPVAPKATAPVTQKAAAPVAAKPAAPAAPPAKIAAPATLAPALAAPPRAVVPRIPVAQPATPPPAKLSTPAPASPLNAVQTLEVLEPGSPLKSDVPFLPFGDETDEGQVRVVTPEDTQTLSDIKLDRQTNAPPCFAVQLVWSVTPIDITKQAHLAIFDAYTLYNVEGNRQGRRWYGLRLGFFSDPNSATQVAYYVRSDYPKVAVVPVASRERERAGGDNAPAGKARLGEPSVALKPESQTAIEKHGLDGFELLKDERPPVVKRDVEDLSGPSKTTARAAIAAAMAKANPSGKPGAKPGAGGKPTGKRVVARPRPAQFKQSYAPGASAPLESTLEILGASTLTLDESQSRAIINDSAIRAPVKKTDNSATGRFVRLLGKLGGA
jgi:hypothetical protein